MYIFFFGGGVFECCEIVIESAWNERCKISNMTAAWEK